MFHGLVASVRFWPLLAGHLWGGHQQRQKNMVSDYVDWISMNFIAQQLLTLKRYEDARVISENNVQEFPNKDLILVTMANIYLALNKSLNNVIRIKG